MRRRNKAIVNAAKSRPCADCGLIYPSYVMDFDHVRGRKLGTNAHMKTYVPPAALAAEIAKCDVVCANCHRIRSHTRAQREQPTRGTARMTVLPPGAQQLRFEWVAGGSNSEPWA